MGPNVCRFRKLFVSLQTRNRNSGKVRSLTNCASQTHFIISISEGYLGPTRCPFYFEVIFSFSATNVFSFYKLPYSDTTDLAASRI